MENKTKDQNEEVLDKEYKFQNKFKKKAMSAVLSVSILLGGLGTGYFVGRESIIKKYSYVPDKSISASLKGVGATDNESNSSNTSNAGPKKPADWDKINKVKEMIYEKYIGEIDENVLLEGAIKGMVSALNDPYTQYYNEKEFKDLNSSTTGKFIGVGIQVGTKEDKITVIAPIDGGPAKDAGILPGDVIIKIDDKPYTGKDLEAAVNVMRGQDGAPVKLTIDRAGKEMDFNLVRREIIMKSVKSEMLQDNIGYVTLTQFTRDADKDFKAALDDLKKSGAKGYIIDFRGNPGGYLAECIGVASNFIEKGKPIFSTQDKYGNKIEDVSEGGDYVGIPMVLLIDEGSASASEVVAGALKDYKLATLIGKKSFGKGIVQAIYDMPDNEGIKITIASYYSPLGTNIHKVGILPDIEVEYPEDLRAKEYNKNDDPQLKKAIEEVSKKMAQ